MVSNKSAMVSNKSGTGSDCLYDFDHAKELDPAGDNDPATRDAREKAKRALATSKDGG